MIRRLTPNLFSSTYWLGLLVGLLIPSLGFGQITTFPYFEDFEGGTGGWTSGRINAATDINTWTRAIPVNPVIDTAYSGDYCWITNNSNFVVFPNFPFAFAHALNEYSFVESPLLDFTNVPDPGFKAAIWWESRFQEHGCILQAQKNGGPWQRVGAYNIVNLDSWYNSDSLRSEPGNSTVGWSGLQKNNTGSNGWTIAQHPLVGFGGEDSVKVRFLFRSNGGADTLTDGFAFDDVTIANLPPLDLGPDTVICFGDSVQLNAFSPQGVRYRWSSSTLDTLPILRAALTDEYIVTVTDSLGFNVRDTLILTVSSTFANLGPDRGICPGDTLTLDAGNPGRDYLWGPSGDTTQTIDVTQTGVYRLRIEDDIGCIEIDSIRIVVDFIPDVDLGVDTNLCAGNLLILDAGAANPGTTYQWSPIAATTQTIQVGAPGQYTVQLTSLFGCISEDTINIDVQFTPNIDLGPDTVICDFVTLDALNPGASYLWSTTDTTQTITPTIGGQYWITVTNAFGCASSDTINLTPGVVPIVDLGPDRIVCGGNNTVLSPTNTADSYLWSTGATTPFLQVATPGQYILTATSLDNCSSSDTIIVLRTPLNVDLGPDFSICVGDTTTLDAGPLPDIYRWSTNESTQTIEVSLPGNYVVTVIDSIGCELRDSVQVTNVPEPVPSLSWTGNRILFNPIQFNGASTGSIQTWSWDFGDGRTSIQQNPIHAFQSVGTFDVCLTVNNGLCDRTTCQQVFVGLVSIDQAFPGQVRIYPNPATDILHVDLALETTAEATYELLNLQGRTVAQNELGWISQSQSQLDIQHLPQGLYLLKLRVGDKAGIAKIWIR